MNSSVVASPLPHNASQGGRQVLCGNYCSLNVQYACYSCCDYLLLPMRRFRMIPIHSTFVNLWLMRGCLLCLYSFHTFICSWFTHGSREKDPSFQYGHVRPTVPMWADLDPCYEMFSYGPWIPAFCIVRAWVNTDRCITSYTDISRRGDLHIMHSDVLVIPHS